MLRTDYILKLKLMLAIVSAVLCVRSSFALGYSCFADISNVDAQVSFATYYDNYDFLGSNGVPTGSDARVAFGAESGYGSRHGNAKGMLTGSLTAKYDGESVSDMLYAVNYYDYNGRIVETHSSKHNSEYETARYAYNLAGKVLKQHTIRYNSSLSELSNDVYAYSYDAGDRVLSATLSHNGATPQAIENCSYDGLGRMNQRICPADTVSTQYNIRGWVTRITEGRRFEQVLSYAAGEQSRFNGNISRNLWKHSASDSYSSYTYAYDNADRLVEAVYSGIGDFSTAYAYDANCNITAISRGGMETEVNGSPIWIDNLTLSYSGNQLTRITDNGEDSGEYGAMEFVDRSNAANEYAYDANGNMTRDLNKGISNITYNLLNLPGEITFTDGRKVKYIYTADGTKVRTTYYDATGSQTLQIDYLGNYILRNGVVDRILTSSGYIKNDTVYSYVKDYQGNVRSVVRQDGAVVESTDYYPYGTPFTTANSVQPYKYGSKELDRMHGLDLYDSQARWYDSPLGRTTTMDPKSEKYYSISPYLWCAGNPVRFVDQYGMSVDEAFEFFSRSINYSVSIGAQLGFNINSGKKSISFDINFRSIDLYNSEGNNKISESINIGCYGFSFSAEKAVWEETDDIAIVESTTAIDFYGLGVNIESTQTASKVAPDLWRLNSDRNSEVNTYYSFPIDTFITADFHCLIGLELKINISDLWNGLKELFSK